MTLLILNLKKKTRYFKPSVYYLMLVVRNNHNNILRTVIALRNIKLIKIKIN